MTGRQAGRQAQIMAQFDVAVILQCKEQIGNSLLKGDLVMLSCTTLVDWFQYI
jgi:hypothetical protein